MLTYKKDVLKELKEKGYSTAYIRKKKILGESTIQRLREGNTDISGKNLALICSMLRCQPGEVLGNVITDAEKIQLFKD